MIFYYSRGGKTKIFAQALGEVTENAAFELESDLNKKGDVGFIVKALVLTFSGKSFPVSNIPAEMPEEIWLCSPIWGGGIAAPAKFFLENADLRNTMVNLLVTASTPVEKYRKNALEFLNKIPCKPGRALIFAASEKVPPEIETIEEQLRDML